MVRTTPFQSHRFPSRKQNIILVIVITSCCSFLYTLLFLSKTTHYNLSLTTFGKTRFNELSSMVNVSNVHDHAQFPLQCWIIVQDSQGRLGNRMFLFASAYGLARLHQCHFYVNPWIIQDLRTVFLLNLTATPIHFLTDNKTISNRTDIYSRYSVCTLYDDLLRVPLDQRYIRYELTGFYQAYGYFDRYREEIGQLFQFNRQIIANITPIVMQLVQSKCGNTVRVSFRRIIS